MICNDNDFKYRFEIAALGPDSNNHAPFSKVDSTFNRDDPLIVQSLSNCYNLIETSLSETIYYLINSIRIFCDIWECK